MSKTLLEPSVNVDVGDLIKRVEALERAQISQRWRPGDLKLTCVTVGTLTGEVEPQPGWLLANDGLVKSYTWPELADAIGAKYAHGGEATDEIRLPPALGRVLIPHASSGTFASVGATGGAETVTLTAAQMPVHDHPATANVTDPQHKHPPGAQSRFVVKDGTNATIEPASGVTVLGDSYTTDTAFASTGISVTVDVQDAGSGQAHSNLQPYLVIDAVLIYAGIKVF